MTSSLWLSNDPIELRCVKKWFETPDTVTIQLSHHSNQPFQFKPGQFVGLGIEIEGKMEYRAYSISSIPNHSFIQITVKRVTLGKMSNYLVDHFDESDTIMALAPAGPFNSIDCPPKQKVAMISAGCGITPVMAMSKAWLEQNANIDITFIHMAKSASHTIYFNELENMSSTHNNFHLKLLLKDNANTFHHQGRLDKVWLETFCPDIAERTVYLCGPTLFMQDMEKNALALGLPVEHFHQESFTPITEQVNSESSSSEGAVQVHVPDFGVSASATQGATLADVLEENGVPIIIACRSGMCGSCRCKVTKGDIERTSTETLSPEDISQGYTLACSTKIQSDVEVAL